MKKIMTALFAVVLMAVTLAGCGSNSFDPSELQRQLDEQAGKITVLEKENKELQAEIDRAQAEIDRANGIYDWANPIDANLAEFINLFYANRTEFTRLYLDKVVRFTAIAGDSIVNFGNGQYYSLGGRPDAPDTGLSIQMYFSQDYSFVQSLRNTTNTYLGTYNRIMATPILFNCKLA